MVSTTKREDNHIEYLGLSTDPKPSVARNGSFFLEMNTGKVFAYDEEHKTGIELE